MALKRDAGEGEKAAREMARGIGVAPLRVWTGGFRGILVEIPEPAAARVDALRRHPLVEYVEQDRYMQALGTQTNPPWHLDRIDQDYLPLNSAYTYGQNGSGVNIYVVDTGVRATHQEFGGRATAVYQAGSWQPWGVDCEGHGTLVASIAAGSFYGVAKGANIKSVRINDCDRNAAASDIVSGLNWVAANATAPAVANLSWTTDSQSIANAIQGVINAGTPVVIGAGNSNVAACGWAGPNVPHVVTVGASNINDRGGISMQTPLRTMGPAWTFSLPARGWQAPASIAIQIPRAARVRRWRRPSPRGWRRSTCSSFPTTARRTWLTRS